MNDQDHNAEIEQLRRWVAADKAEIDRLNRLLVGVRNAFNRECDDLDAILRALGLDPVNCRTEGGSLMLQDRPPSVCHASTAAQTDLARISWRRHTLSRPSSKIMSSASRNPSSSEIGGVPL